MNAKLGKIFARLNGEQIKKSWLHIFLLIIFIMAIATLMILDYFNMESISYFNEGGFYFDFTWKGRLFLLFFLAVFMLESATSFKGLQRINFGDGKRKFFRISAIVLCASLPLIYILSINFLGLDQVVIGVGDVLRGDYWRTQLTNWSNFLTGDWPLSLEYLVFAISFAASMLLAYGKRGLKAFSIALALVGGISAVYMVDTIYPYAVLKPLQLLALPTASCAAAVLEIIGYRVNLLYSSGPTSAPVISVYSNGSPSNASVNWPCAGVQSLFLYVIIILLLFEKSGISRLRKIIYFIIGGIGTYFVNVMRIVTIFQIMVNQGTGAAQVFHSVYGELYFFVWIFVYIILILSIERFRLVEKAANRISTLNSFLKGRSSKTNVQY